MTGEDGTWAATCTPDIGASALVLAAAGLVWLAGPGDAHGQGTTAPDTVRRVTRGEATEVALRRAGALGIALGTGASRAFAELAGWNSLVSAEAVTLAVAFSAAVGIFFGLWPARRASLLDPIEALRYE